MKVNLGSLLEREVTEFSVFALEAKEVVVLRFGVGESPG